MIDITLNGEPRTLPQSLSVAELLAQYQLDPYKIVVEINHQVVPRLRHAERAVGPGDAVEITSFVGGGAAPPADKPLTIGKFTFRSRLITGTGKYASYDLMRDCLAASNCEVTTVAV